MGIRVPKDQSAFTYFILESNEGLCFYSTLDESLGQTYRDIDLKGDLRLVEEIDRLLCALQKEFPLHILYRFEIESQ